MPEIVPLWPKNRGQRVHMGGIFSNLANKKKYYTIILTITKDHNRKHAFSGSCGPGDITFITTT